MKEWKCPVCGYTERAQTPPAKCPVCGADQEKFISLDEESPSELSVVSAPAEDQSPEAPNQDENSRWQCTVCGYIHVGGAPPEKCPICGADKSKFILMAPESAAAKKEDATQGTTEHGKTNSMAALARRAQILSRYHAHPIAVHIPNGVLPLTVMFTLFAFLFHSQDMATAAKINMIFICLSMPAVIICGWIDWQNRFEGRMTNVFLIKMVCGGIVTLLTLTIALWWLVAPDIYLSGIGQSSLFIILNLADFAAAATAGFFGGKLVFHE